MSGDRDELDDRMKAYEAVETARAFDAAFPVYARIDGRTFSSFTRHMRRPFDERMIAAMTGTTRHLVKETGARIGYTQSDEISLVLLVEGEAQPLFGARVHKLTSVLASLGAAAFQRELPKAFGSEEGERLAELLPHFDARVFALPSRIEAANAVLWRTLDARKNAVLMAAQAVFSHKALHGKDQSDLREMLASAGVEFDAYPQSFRQGTFLRRVSRMRELTEEERARIPEPHRPAAGDRVLRHVIEAVEMPDFVRVANRVEVIFDGAEPVVAN